MADDEKKELRMIAIGGGHLFLIAQILKPYEGRMLHPDEVMALIQKASTEMGGFPAQMDLRHAH